VLTRIKDEHLGPPIIIVYYYDLAAEKVVAARPPNTVRMPPRFMWAGKSVTRYVKQEFLHLYKGICNGEKEE
jgi:hypothetical protein